MRRWISIAAVAWLAACSSSPDKPADGTEGGACTDTSCGAGLVCASEICVRPPESDSGINDVSSATPDTGSSASDGGSPDLAMPDMGVDDVGTEDLGVDTGNPMVGEPPTCVINSPADGSSHAFFAEIEFAATATDVEDGALTGESVVWSSDLLGELGTGASLTRTVELGGTHAIRCTVTDSDGNVGFSEVSMAIMSPIARIFHPATGETRTAGSMIPFVGRGDDAEEGQLVGASLVWTSNIDGQIGTGETFDAPLSVGMNVVTLTVTDADSNAAQTSITLDMVP